MDASTNNGYPNLSMNYLTNLTNTGGAILYSMAEKRGAQRTEQRDLKSTRDRVIALLRRGAQTVEDLAKRLGLTDNAVRAHLVSLERDEVVRQEGLRRGAGAGKPATIYELHPEAEVELSRAYAPVLRALVNALTRQLPPDQAEAILKEVGHELSQALGGPASGDLDARVRAAGSVLTALGGDVEIQTVANRPHCIQGFGCPLAATVREQPLVCGAVEALLADVVGERVVSQCEHGPRPQCCFVIEPRS